MGRAFDKRNLVLMRVDEAGDRWTGSRAHLVHEDVVMRGGFQRANHGPVEELFDRFDCGPGSQRAAGSIEERLAEGAGKMMTGGEHDERDISHSTKPRPAREPFPPRPISS